MSAQSQYPQERQPWERILPLAAALVIALLLLAGCSPRIVEKVRYEYIYTERVDTTFIKDSVYLKEYIKGDTVRIVEFRDRYKYQYKMVRDTVAVHDTTAIETVKTVEVEKPLSGYQKAGIGAFPWLVAAIALLLAWTFRKRLLKL